MIKANELRFGNFIIEDDGCMAKVTGFSPLEHLTICDTEEGCQIHIDICEADGKVKKGYSAESKLCRPIELTPEWLGRCGFVSIDDDGIVKVWTQSLVYIGNKEGKFYLYTNCTDPWYNETISSPIETVHHLQNLYFALTGEELQIKMP